MSAGHQPDAFIGLMTGTSLDGVDAARVDFIDDVPQLAGTFFMPYPDSLRAELLALNSPQHDDLARAAQAGVALAKLYAEACAPLLAAGPVRAIGCHGQTLRHRPADGYTLQIGNPAQLAELTATPVIADFRSRDIAAGGQGAPLVPAFHARLLAHPECHRVIVNIGGIANLTDLAPHAPVRGWDTGPGNLLMDGWIMRHHGQPYDRDGAWAQSGCVHDRLLDVLLMHEFFLRPRPKSAGREEFNLAWLDRVLTDFPGLAAADVQATLAAFTARSIADDIRLQCGGAKEIYLCGGGVHNTALRTLLQQLLPACRVASTAQLGLDPDWVEAMAFAWLARQCLSGYAGNLPAVTGAAGLRVLGAIYPA